MDNPNLRDPYVQRPTFTSDKKPWTQRCFVCLKVVNFLKDTPGVEYIHVAQYVRHRKCYPK